MHSWYKTKLICSSQPMTFLSRNLSHLKIITISTRASKILNYTRQVGSIASTARGLWNTGKTIVKLKWSYKTGSACLTRLSRKKDRKDWSRLRKWIKMRKQKLNMRDWSTRAQFSVAQLINWQRCRRSWSKVWEKISQGTISSNLAS